MPPTAKCLMCVVMVALAIITSATIPSVYAALPANTYFYLSGSPTAGTSTTACGGTWGALDTSTNTQTPINLSGSSTSSGFYCFASVFGTTYSLSTATDSGQYTFQFVWSGSGWAGSTVTVAIFSSAGRRVQGTQLGTGTLTVPSGSGGSRMIAINVANGGAGCTSNCYLQFAIKSNALTTASVTMTVSGSANSWLIGPPVYLMSYAINGGGSGYTAPTLTYTKAGATGQTLVLTTSAQSVYIDPSTTYSVTNPLSGSTGSERWSTSTASGSSAIGGGTVVFTYYHQYLQTLSYLISGGGTPTAPTYTATKYGASAPQVLTTSATGYWYDSGSSWSVSPNPLTGSGSSERWYSSQTLSGTISSSSTLVFTFYHQYLQTLSYSVAGGGTGYSAPTYTANQFGLPFGQPLTITPTGYWFDNGASWTVTNPLGGSTGSEQWITSQSTSGTISSAQTFAFSYQHQYYLSMLAGTGGSVTPASGWRNSGANVTITGIPKGGYAFASWTCTGTGCYVGAANPSWVLMNAIISETGNFNPITATIRIDNLTLSTSSGGANMTTPQNVNPTVEYWYGTGAYDSQAGTDFQSITLDLYRTGHTSGTFAQSFVYSFRWVANGWSGTPSCSTSPGCWQELQSSGWVASSFNYLVSTDSSVTTISGSALTAEWQFAVKLDQLAVYTTNGAGLWNFKVTAVSKSSGNPSGARAGTLDVNLLIIITAPGNMSWGTVAAGSVNVTATGMPVYTTYTANAIVNITIYGNGDPANQYGDSFPLSYIYVGKTGNPANNDGVVVSTSSKVFYSSLPVAANANLPTYWFISTPNPFTPGSYTFTYYETIQLQSMQT
jgi:hypothetical protein